MMVCPSCGEVYPDRTTSCPADRTALVSWGSQSDAELGRHTDVDPLAPVGDLDLADDPPRTPTSRPASRVLAARYRLGRRLGIGGFGAVFAAEDLHGGAAVAIKLLSPAVEPDAELVTRFHREAIAVSRIHHPNIIEVIDFDVDDRGAQFIVMECLDGSDLADRLDHVGRLPPAHALAIALQCARGLAAAHEVGVLHRDLKPANIFLVGAPDRARVKVIDFGISKLTCIAGDYTDVTRSSRVVGTPRYMPPEQAQGQELDARADVYALGVVLFEMLTGELPFAGRSPLELFGQHLRAPRRPPSALIPELAACPGLDRLVVTALAADRRERFASMVQFADAMAASLRAIAPDLADELAECSGEVAVAAPPTRRVPPWSAYRPAVVAIALAGVLAFALATARRDPAPAAHPAAPADAPIVEPTLDAPPPSPAAEPPPLDAGVAPAALTDAAPAPRPRPPRRAAASKLGVSEW